MTGKFMEIKRKKKPVNYDSKMGSQLDVLDKKNTMQYIYHK